MFLAICSNTTGCTDCFSPLNNTSSFKSLEAGCFCFRRLNVLSSRESIPLELLIVNNFNALLTFLFSISKANFLDNSPMLFGVLMWCKRDWVLSSANKSSSILPLIHWPILLSSAFRWSFDVIVLLEFEEEGWAWYV